MDNKHYNLRIKGNVQGVWYRASSRNKAMELNLKGFVCNMPDGSVYAEIEGPETQCRNFVAWAAKGPDHARVDHIEIEESKFLGFEAFEIRR